MRLLVVSQYFWPENFRVNDLVAELVARGHTVTVLTGKPNYPDGQIFSDYRSDPARFTEFAGARVLRIPVVPRGSGSVWLVINYLSFVVSGLLLGPWRLRGQEFDAIFVFQTSPITSALPAILLRRVKRAPLLMWVLDLWPDTLDAIGVVRAPWALACIGRLVGFIYRRCDRVLVQSSAFMPNVERYAGDTSRIRYFPNWAEPTFEVPSNAAALAPEADPYKDCFNVVFAGNIGEAQDFPAILVAAEAMRDEPSLRWLIVGDGRSASWLRNEIVRRGLDRNVVMLGRHPIERMPSFFRAAGALLVSLKKEPIFALTVPGKVQSYLAAGLPIVAMLDGEGAKVIEQAGAGLVCGAGEGLALAQRVSQLMRLSNEARAAMGARGRRYCEREFDRKRLVSALEKWIEELIDEWSVSPPLQPPTRRSGGGSI